MTSACARSSRRSLQYSHRPPTDTLMASVGTRRPPSASVGPRRRAKFTCDPQSSVSEYLYLASLQNTLTEGPRGFSDVIGVSKERTEEIDNFHKCPRHTGP